MCKSYKTSKIKEAKHRLGALGYSPKTVEELSNGFLFKSEGDTVRLSPLTASEMNIVHEFENQHNALVYAVIYTPTRIGDLLHMLFVSDEKCEWIYERDEIRRREPTSFIYNLTYPNQSVTKTIGVSCRNGGLARVR